MRTGNKKMRFQCDTCPTRTNNPIADGWLTTVPARPLKHIHECPFCADKRIGPTETIAEWVLK